MIPNPKRKYDEFLEILNGMIPPKDVNVFLLNRIQTEAQRMKDDSPAEAFALLGVVSCLRNNVADMHINHKNALHYENSPRQKELYGTSLLNCHLFAEAYKYLLPYYEETDGKDIDTLDKLIRCVFYLDREDEFDQYVKDWFKLTGKDHLLATSFPEDDDFHLSTFMDCMDTHINSNPDVIEELDADMFALAEELVIGVDIET